MKPKEPGYHPLTFAAFLLAFFMLIWPTQADIVYYFLRQGKLLEATLVVIGCIAIVALPLLLAQRSTNRHPGVIKGVRSIIKEPRPLNMFLGILPKNITATELSTQLPAIIEKLIERGVNIKGGVDAKNLSAAFGSKKFDRIIWNFPNTASRKPGNGIWQLVEPALKSMSAQLKESGRIILTFKNGTGYPNPSTVASRARNNGLRVVEQFPFELDSVKGYKHTKTGGGTVQFPNGATTYILEK